MPETTALREHWAHLLELLAAYEPVAAPVPAQLFACAGNPGDLPARIAASWAGLCADLRVHPVAGDHLSILRPPAVDALTLVPVAAHE